MKYFISLFLVLLSVSAVSAQVKPAKGLLELNNDMKALTSSSLNKKGEAALQLQEAKIEGKKSSAKAILYSLLLPGMGELYAGNYESGKYFTIAEGVLWGTYAGMAIYSNWRKDNYKSFAATRGGVNVDGKDADYFANIGDYVSIDDYNHQMSLDREYKKIYSSPDYNWNWGTQNVRSEYRLMWISSEKAHNNLRFAVGGMLINRVISAINAVRLVRRHNKNLEQTSTGWNISVGVNPYAYAPAEVSLNFRANF